MLLLVAITSWTVVTAWVSPTAHCVKARTTATSRRATRADASSTSTSAWFVPEAIQRGSIERVKAQVLQLGAALDRGQAYNPTSGAYYEDSMKAATRKIEELIGMGDDSTVPSTLEQIEGEWELVLSTVPHGIFRSRYVLR